MGRPRVWPGNIIAETVNHAVHVAGNAASWRLVSLQNGFGIHIRCIEAKSQAFPALGPCCRGPMACNLSYRFGILQDSKNPAFQIGNIPFLIRQRRIKIPSHYAMVICFGQPPGDGIRILLIDRAVLTRKSISEDRRVDFGDDGPVIQPVPAVKRPDVNLVANFTSNAL